MIFPERCCFITGGDGVARIDGPVQVYFRDKVQERRIEGAGLGVHRPTTTSARVRDQDIDPAPCARTTRATIASTAS